MILGLSFLPLCCSVQCGLQSEKAWTKEWDGERPGGREKWMPVAGLPERRWGGDEIPPYLSRQLHLADFYLDWQRGMWGSLRLAFNWLCICQHFSTFPPFKAPEGSGNIDFHSYRIWSQVHNWMQSPFSCQARFCTFKCTPGFSIRLFKDQTCKLQCVSS